MYRGWTGLKWPLSLNWLLPLRFESNGSQILGAYRGHTPRVRANRVGAVSRNPEFLARNQKKKLDERSPCGKRSFAFHASTRLPAQTRDWGENDSENQRSWLSKLQWQIESPGFYFLIGTGTGLHGKSMGQNRQKTNFCCRRHANPKICVRVHPGTLAWTHYFVLCRTGSFITFPGIFSALFVPKQVSHA